LPFFGKNIGPVNWKLPALCRLFSFVVLLAIVFDSQAQKRARKIEILGANDLIYDDSEGVRAKKLIGDVKIKHGKTYMDCDSAYVYSKTNTMKAYGNVHIYDNDGLELFGDSLKYFGDTKLAQVRGNEVKLIQDDMTLVTQFLDFDRNNEVGYYWNGGNILMNNNKDSLFSYKGYYFTQSSTMQFKDSVRLRTPDYIVKSDTLHYNSSSQKSHFFGPTFIESEGDLIYTEKGWSDNKNKVSVFTKNAYIISKEQELYGDSIYYNQKDGIGEVFNNVTLLDTSNNFMVQGEYVYLNQIDSTSLVLGEPMLTQFFEKDSLYLHADTLYSNYDSTRKYRLIHAYPKAQFYKSDMQGKSDSLVFSDVDSSITMYHDPIIWSEANQITARLITIYKKGENIDRMTMDYRSFITSLEDSTSKYRKYNQIKGDSMIGHFKENRLNSVDVNHNGVSIYFAKEDSGGYIGMNKSKSEYMTIYLDSNSVKEIMFRQSPEATLYPIKDVTPRMQYLKRFKWRDSERPKKREDIFNWKEEEEIEGE
tara:strand:+ start:13475 stop:15076 length:1602 start_codon:yes stop_codon:yes gene_type:complete